MLRLAPLVASLVLVGCVNWDIAVSKGNEVEPRQGAVDSDMAVPWVPGVDHKTPLPLTDTGNDTYLGFEGGLYAKGSNEIPAAHLMEGLNRANAVKPLDKNGNPSANGKVVLLAVGGSLVTQEMCGGGFLPSATCAKHAFVGQAEASPDVAHDRVVLIDGGAEAQTPDTWDAPTDHNYNRVAKNELAPKELSEKQVQVVWLKGAFAFPKDPLPAPGGDSDRLVKTLGDTVRALKTRYPNLKLIFLSSRTYGGYDNLGWSPEPFAFESGLAVKWLIQAQIDQAQDGAIHDTRAGDLAYSSSVWIGWGPYLWTNGDKGRKDGLVWLKEDVDFDGIHPSMSGEAKAGKLLLDFFSTSRVTRCWFLQSAVCN